MNERYIEFENYRLRRGEVVGSNTIRVYSAVGPVVRLFPFVTVLTVIVKDKGGKDEEVELYQLRNASNEIIFLTDSDGLGEIFSSAYSAVSDGTKN